MGTRLAWAGVVSFAALVAVSGCSESTAEGLDLPTPTTPTASNSPTPTATLTQAPTPTVPAEEQAVLAAYQAFYAAIVQAEADPVQSQVYLEPVATGLQFETTNGAVKARLLDGEERFGTPVLNPVVQSIEGETAKVQDCQDTSGVGRRKIGSVEPISVGRNPSSAETTLELVEGIWKVAATEFVEPPEAFCS